MRPDQQARMMIGLRWARVVAVRRGEGAAKGATAAQWLCDVEDTSGALLRGCRVLGAVAPVVHTDERPSWCLVGAIAGSINNLVVWPCPNTTAREGHAEHEVMAELSGLAVYVTAEGDVQLRSRPGEAGGGLDDAPLVRLRPAGHGPDHTAELLGGSRRLARGGSPAGGDYVAIDAETSPLFAGWCAEVAARVGVLQNGVAAALASLVAWANSPAWFGVGPGPAGAPPAPPGPGILIVPMDRVPAVDDVPEQPPEGVQVVGQITTSSPWTKGK